MKRLCIGVLMSLTVVACASTVERTSSSDRERFVSLQDEDPTIFVEMRYADSHNFVGRPITGYRAPKCLLTKEAATALAAVQKDLKPFSLSLKVYDCYRPQKAVNDFVTWAKALADTKMKREFYPRVDKTALFKDGYIAEKSGHSRGSTMDLTLVALPAAKQEQYREGKLLRDCALAAPKRFQDNSLDMGTGYDCFDPLAHTANSAVGPLAQKNRLLLKALMEKHGFKNLDEEWWHYTLKNEPFPETFFDFDVQ